MKELNLEALFSPPERQDAPEPWRLPAWVTDWQQWLTFTVMLLVVQSAALSVQAADWVPGMPALWFTSLAGLVTAMALARVRVNELLLHPFGLLTGAAVVLAQVLLFLDGGSPQARLSELWHRMTTWVDLVRSGGISTDDLPFVLIVVAVAWLAAYVGGWAAFRWRNGWLAVIPSGVALLVNLSYQPGHFSPAFAAFGLGALLLLMQANLARAIRSWRRQGADYPEFLTLTMLNGTLWAALALLAVALALPTGGPLGGLSQVWRSVRAPVEGWTIDWGLFTTIDAKRPAPVHRFEDAMPLQGAIKLNGRFLGTVSTSNSPYPVLLRAAVYEEYTGTGWKATARSRVPLGDLERAAQAAGYDARHEMTVTVDPERGGDVLLGAGQPLSADQSAKAEVVQGAPYPEVTRVLGEGDEPYTVRGTVSAATADELRAAGTAYPPWVQGCCLQLPEDLPDRVRELAFEWAGRRDNPYDIARAIESELRTYQVDYAVPVAPPGRDAVDHFLFETRRGYFDYHASAMVVLLRVHGIPARLAVGYLPRELDPSGRFYTLREREAFAWVEAYFPGYGWVEFNPTTGSPLIDRETAAPDAGEGNLPMEPANPEDLPAPLPDIPLEGDLVYEAPPQEPGRPWGWYALGGAGLAAAVATLAGWVLWQRSVAGLPYPAQLWEKAVRLAGWAQVPQRAHETPWESARRVRQSVPGTAEVEALADAYVRSRYGGKGLEDGDRRELTQVWRRVRNRLLARILHWR